MASTFKHDARGFLVGEIVENGRDLLRAMQQSGGTLKEIGTDTLAKSRSTSGWSFPRRCS